MGQNYAGIIMRYAMFALAVAVLTTSAIGRTNTPSKDERSTCAATSTEIAHSVTLTPGCVYNTTFRIISSGVVFDCAGAVIDGSGGLDFGIIVDGRTPLTNIVIRNCNIRDTQKTALGIGWIYNQSEFNQLDHATAYSKASGGVIVENSTIVRPKVNGIMVNAYSRNNIIRGVTFEDWAAVGIYLEASSANNIIENNVFKSSSSKVRREAIAVDSSSNNIIRNNSFLGNMPGGVYLYKNCQEHITTRPASMKRWMPSEKNLIENNYFDGQKVGIWVASRQSADLSRWDCGDPSYANGKYFRDYAPNNVIRTNHLDNVVTPIIVEDDGNTVSDNTIVSASRTCIRVGTGPRSEILNKPVINTRVENNRCEGPHIEKRGGYEFVFGASPKTFVGNRTNGSQSVPNAPDERNSIAPKATIRHDLSP